MKNNDIRQMIRVLRLHHYEVADHWHIGNDFLRLATKRIDRRAPLKGHESNRGIEVQ